MLSETKTSLKIHEKNLDEISNINKDINQIINTNVILFPSTTYKICCAFVLFVFLFVLNKIKSFLNHINKYTHRKIKQKHIIFSFFFVIFFSYTFQSFDDTTKTLLISSSNDFEDPNKSEAEHVIIEGDITEIPALAFSHASVLSSVNIGDSVTIIRYQAFYDCSNLKTVIMGKNVNSIEYSAFENCNSLNNITLPNKLQIIAD